MTINAIHSIYMEIEEPAVCCKQLETAFDHECETWGMRAELESKMEMTEMRMIRWMCGISTHNI